jgi:hypothetical protein
MSLQIQKYTDKSIVIRGDTKARLTDIKAISGAKFGYYGGEPGWMFPLTMEAQVRRSLNIAGSAYVDGPKPNPRSGGFEPRASAPSGSSTESLLMPKAASAKPAVRGSLRGKAPEDPEESEQKSEQELQELRATVSQLKAENASILGAVSQLQDQLAALTKRFDELAVEEVEETTEETQ